MIKILILSLILISACFAADDKALLPTSAATAMKTYEAELAKAKAEYDKREETARKALLPALAKAKDAEMKANNLEGALAIKKKIDEFSDQPTNSVVIISASYGFTKDNTVNALKYIIEKTENGTKPYIDHDNAWKIIGNPAPRDPKGFFIKYKINGKIIEKRFGENDTIEFKAE
jgi:hypothetical protein